MDLCLATFRPFVVQWLAKITGRQPQLKPLLLNICLYNFGKHCHKVVIVQRIAIKQFHIFLCSCLQLKKLTQGIRWGSLDGVPFPTVLQPLLKLTSLSSIIWIPSVSIIPWIQSFIA